MNEFKQICREAEALDPVEYGAILAVKTAKIMPALHALTRDPAESARMLAIFMIGSVYADGKLDEAEYELMKPMLEAFFGQEVNFEQAKKVVKAFSPEGKELKQVVDYVVDLLGELDEELKADIITVCLLVCAIDGKISRKEEKYIRQLIA